MVGTEEKTATQLYNSPTTLHLHLGERERGRDERGRDEREREREISNGRREIVSLTTDSASSYFFLKATSHAHFPLQTHKPSINTHSYITLSLSVCHTNPAAVADQSPCPLRVRRKFASREVIWWTLRLPSSTLLQ